jgi:hypothetical protein
LTAAVALAPRPQIQLQHDAKIVGHHQRLDAATQAAQGERRRERSSGWLAT